MRNAGPVRISMAAAPDATPPRYRWIATSTCWTPIVRWRMPGGRERLSEVAWRKKGPAPLRRPPIVMAGGPCAGVGRWPDPGERRTGELAALIGIEDLRPTVPDQRFVNRAPVLTLWATVVAERLGYPPETALTLGRFVAGSSARAKARRLGISDDKQDAEERYAQAAELKPTRQAVRLLGRDIPVLDAADGTLRAEDDC